MSAVDITTLREGDTVLVRGVVKNARDEMVIELSAQTATRPAVSISSSRNYDIASVEPRPLAVGDKVGNGTVCQSEIIGIDGAYAWCRNDDGARFTALLANLVRA